MMQALIIVAMIVIIYLLYKRMLNMRKPFPVLLPGKSTEDSSVVYLGKADTPEKALELAKAVPGVKLMIYYNDTEKDFAKMVYGVKRGDLVIPESEIYTAVPLKENFEKKSLLLGGSQNAGSESMENDPFKGSFYSPEYRKATWEQFETPDIARNTVWAGHMNTITY